MLRLFLSLLAFFGLLLIGSCGRQSFPDYRDDPISYERIEGRWRAKFRSLNAKQVGVTRGYSVIRARGNQFYAKVNTQNHIPHIRHHQYIHRGSRCPDKRADRNRDGIIDFQEVLEFSGKVILPLDAKIASKIDGFLLSPVSNKEGRYLYAESGHMGRMLEELRGYPGIPNENFCRLEYAENLDLEKRTIIIYGNGVDDMLPIACGEFKIDLSDED